MIARQGLLRLALSAVVAVGACTRPVEDDRTVVLRPGQDIQAIVAQAAEGTRFRFEPGIYRQQTIYPNSGQAFIGQDGVILSGAMAMTSWTRNDGFWTAEGLPRPLDFHGECDDGRDLCSRREDLFVDGRLYVRVGSLAELAPGRWYYAHRRAYLADDPTGRFVELGVTPLAFAGDAADVLLEDLIVEKYASDAQQGAIYADAGHGWRLSGVTARWNHGAGLSFGSKTRVSGGSFSHNGQLGIRASGGEGSSVEGVEIAFNNYAGYDSGWEAGGAKFLETNGLSVRRSCVHDNGGPGLWTDVDNINTIYEENKVFMNADDGIKHEISYAAIIRNNIVVENGSSGFDVWLWGSQILIQNSSNTEVEHNLVEVAATFGNGIGIIYQDRGRGAYGRWQAANNSVNHNAIVLRGRRGHNGVVADADEDRFWRDAGNSFDWNTYIVADRSSPHWLSNDREELWDAIEDLGFEKNGKLIVEQRAPVPLSCER